MGTLSWLAECDEAEARRRVCSFVDEWVSKGAHNSEKISTINLFLTRKCNLRCQHCYINGAGPKSSDHEFSLVDVQHVIEQARQHGLRKVKVSGGEPMLHRQFDAIIQYLERCDLEIIVESNGTLLKANDIARFSRVKNLSIALSLDDIDQQAHDLFRGGKGAFVRTAAALQSLGMSDIDTVVTSTAHRNNYHKITNIIDMVVSWGIKRHRTLVNIHPIGNARSHSENALTISECEELIEAVLSSHHYESGRASIALPPALVPLNYIRTLQPCGWGSTVVGILSNGQISMCSASYEDPDMIGGNAFERPLIDIWRSGDLFRELREIGKGKVKGVCGNCIFYAVCRGACKMSSWAHYGEKQAPYPLCQEIYNAGKFPKYALFDSARDTTYSRGVIPLDRGN